MSISKQTFITCGPHGITVTRTELKIAGLHSAHTEVTLGKFRVLITNTINGELLVNLQPVLNLTVEQLGQLATLFDYAHHLASEPDGGLEGGAVKGTVRQ